MANSILGNNGACNYYLTEHETEVDEDEYEDLMGEFVDELDVFGYRGVTPKASQTTSVKVFFYYKAPTSEWYWDYMYGDPYDPIIPLVFSCDSNWKLTELLNSSTYEVTLAGRANGWVEMNVTLKRKLVKNERVFFGVYSDTLGVVHTHDYDPTGNCYLYYSSIRRSSYNSQIAFVTASEWINKATGIAWEYDICIYLQYENEIESVAYTRTVLGNIGAITANSHKAGWKRTLRPGGNISSTLSRKAVWKRNSSSNGSYVSSVISHNSMTRGSSSAFSVSDSNSKRLFFYRTLENISLLNARNNRALGLKIEEADEFSLSDNLQHLLLILRSVFSAGGLSENLTKKAEYKRMPESYVDDEETITRWGESYRGFTDEIEIEASPFASRLFFRTIQTVMCLWDWLRGKNREANNVVTFFCPIHTEIEFECKI